MIGVIVPVYKTEKYVAECIESILAQTYTNLRLILVDDGSPDGAGTICDKYALKDNRITVIHQENAGVTRARARGVEEATDCEWITFVDSDDILPKNSLERLHSATIDDSCISIGGISRFNSTIKTKSSINLISYITAEELRHNVLVGKDCSLCAKLIKKELFDNKIFDIPQSIVMGEDTIACTRIAFNNNNSVTYCKKNVYYYRQHSDSCMHTFKHSAKYEQQFIEHLQDSIPSRIRNKYINTLIERRIRSFDSFFGYSSNIPEWIGSCFHKQLITDIKTYKYRKLPIERLLLTTTNKQLRCILIFIKRIKNKIEKYLNNNE